MLLCELDASPDVPTLRFNQTPAHIAAQHGSFLCLKWLMHCGAACNRQVRSQSTQIPFFHSSLFLCVWAVQLGCLRALGCGPGSVVMGSSRSGSTPTHLAAQAGHTDCLRWLLQENNSCVEQVIYTSVCAFALAFWRSATFMQFIRFLCFID